MDEEERKSAGSPRDVNAEVYKTRGDLDSSIIGPEILIRAHMPDFRELTSKTDRRASFEIISVFGTNPAALLVEN